MSHYLGIYGYNFTQSFEYSGLIFEPKFSNAQDARSKAADPETYNLTGTISIPDGEVQFNNNFFYDVEAVLSFIDHRKVTIRKNANADSQLEAFEQLPISYKWYNREDGGGPIIMEDAFSKTSRSDFFKAAMGNLHIYPHEAFRQCFHKVVHSFANPINYLDIIYFLHFSGIEALARDLRKTFDGSAVVPITEVWKSYGFDVVQNNDTSDIGVVQNHCHLRNAIFHNSRFEKTVPTSSGSKTLVISDFLYPLRTLVQLSVMKYVCFDDGHINWNAWRDRQPFKSKT